MELKEGSSYLLVHANGLGLMKYQGEETRGHKFLVTRSDGIQRVMHLSEQKWREIEPYCHEQKGSEVPEGIDSLEAAREFMTKLKESLNE